MKWFSRAVVGMVVLTLLLVLACDIWVMVGVSGRSFDRIEQVPHNTAGVLLATSPVTRTGRHNYSFDKRIVAADRLFKAGKVDYIIASGGDYTRTESYGCDEPAAIRDSLVERGVPADRIVLDYEGTRTVLSVAKAREVYGLDSVTFISQRYHNERAIVLADRYGMHPVAFNAQPSPYRLTRFKSALRELLARVKMCGELALGRLPHFSHDA